MIILCVVLEKLGHWAYRSTLPPQGETEVGFLIHLFCAKQQGRSVVSTSPNQHLRFPLGGWFVLDQSELQFKTETVSLGKPLLDT